MKINYVPGLALRFFPGLSRDPMDAYNDYIASGAKIAIFTGTAPTENELWNLTDFEAFKVSNAQNLVYSETTELQFKYDAYKHKRVIQRYPIDSIQFTPTVVPVAQDLITNPEAIVTDNSLYALVYCPDKDVTLNTASNDMVILIPNVGTRSDDFMSLSKVDFTAEEEISLRNMTIALFQGYQITDSQIIEEIEDPENPGSMIPTVVGTKKSIYYNKIWGNKVSEAYRDCFVSRSSITNLRAYYIVNNTNSSTYTWSKHLGNLTQPFHTGIQLQYGTGASVALRKYDKVNGVWLNELFTPNKSNISYKFGFVVNQAVLDLIDEINLRGQNGLLPNYDDLNFNAANINGIEPEEVNYRLKWTWENTVTNENAYPLMYTNLDYMSGILVKYLINQVWYSQEIADSYLQFMIEIGFDESLVSRAIKSIVPFDLDLSKWTSTFDKDSATLTVQNLTPSKMYKRFKNSVQNPTNEELYILLPRYLNRTAINQSIYRDGNVMNVDLVSTIFPKTQTVLDGEVTDENSQQVRLNDYTAISIGLTGNGQTDLEYDILDTIDYIDSFTTMVKIPNKF